jgi:hypothetical protein
LARKLRRRRQRRVFLGWGLALAGAAVATGVGIWAGKRWRTPDEYDFGHISCADVQKLAQAYGQGKLDGPVRERVRRHVAQCPKCGPLFQSMGLTT